VGAALHQDEEHEQQRGGCEAADNDRAPPALFVAADQRVDQKEERGAQDRRAANVDPGGGRNARLAQPQSRDHERGQADRHVHEKNPAPRQPVDKRTAHKRPDRDSRGRGPAPDAERRPAFATLELLRDQRERRAEHHRRADALGRARDVQEEGVGSQPTGQRRSAEDRQPEHENEPPADHVSQRPRR